MYVQYSTYVSMHARLSVRPSFRSFVRSFVRSLSVAAICLGSGQVTGNEAWDSYRLLVGKCWVGDFDGHFFLFCFLFGYRYVEGGKEAREWRVCVYVWLLRGVFFWRGGGIWKTLSLLIHCTWTFRLVGGVCRTIKGRKRGRERWTKKSRRERERAWA